MSESERKSIEQLLQQAKNIHQTTQLKSLDMKAKLNFMLRKIQNSSSYLLCGFCSSQKHRIDPGFKRAFKKLALNEKVIYFWRICSSIKNYQSQKNNYQQTIISIGQKQILDTTVYIKEKIQYQNWTVTRIKASLKNRKINITDKSIVLDMHDYLIRTVTNKQKQKSFALQSTSLNQTYQTLKFSNQATSYEQLFNFFKKIQKQVIKDQIRQIFSPGSRNKVLEQLKINKNLTNNSTSNQSPKITTTIYNSLNSLDNKMMTLKLISQNYALTPKNIIEKQMIERASLIKLKDQSYNQIYKILLPQKLLQNLQDFKHFNKIKQTQKVIVYYHKQQSIVRKKYIFKRSQFVILDWLVDQLNNISNFQKWKANLIKINYLGIFPFEKTKILHQIYKHETKNLNYVFIRHYFTLKNTKKNIQSKKVHYYFDQSISLPICKNYFGITQNIINISYIIWKFYQTQDSIQLLVEAKCNHIQNKIQNIKMTQNYLGEFEKLKNHPITMKNISQDSEIHLNTILFQNQYIDQINQLEEIDNETEFFTISEKEENVSINTNKKITNIQINKQKQNHSMTKKQQVSIIHINSINQNNYLKLKHPLLPYKKDKPIFKVPQTGNHPQWQSQWKITQKGQLININKQKIDAQNNVLKSVFKTLGRNLISGKSILSISLPVQVFGDDSNLSRLCNSYGYAPIFLEAAAQTQDPIERFKNVISFGMTTTVNYLRMDKPFNPILGQTYQSLIDGCPVYGQQISHHPPISAVFMKGRGYTLFGHLQAKVQLSLNSANGINQGQICVCFDNQNLNKNKIRYTGPAGQLSGVLYGDRKMSMIKKSYYIDEQNGLYCQVNWSKHKGKKEPTNKYYDSVQGQVFQLKKGINLKNYKTCKKNDIQREIGLIHGRWTGAVYYNDNLIFNTYQTFPHVVQLYQPLLQSDVSKRKDLILRRESKNLQKAQQAKQELQQIQRKDRKLRAQYNANNQKH